MALEGMLVIVAFYRNILMITTWITTRETLPCHGEYIYFNGFKFELFAVMNPSSVFFFLFAAVWTSVKLKGWTEIGCHSKMISFFLIFSSVFLLSFCLF